jgi:hypothetical protein
MAVTFNRVRAAVFGNIRASLWNVNIGATGQSLSVPFHTIESEIADGGGTVASPSSVAIEASIPTPGGNGPITFNYSGGGAQNNVDLLILSR